LASHFGQTRLLPKLPDVMKPPLFLLFFNFLRPLHGYVTSAYLLT
jgi:hypothetical protein